MNKHLLLITPGFAAHEHDSAAVPYLQDYCRHLASAIGSEHITIVATQYPFTRKPYHWNNIQVIPVGGANKKGIAQLFNFFRTQRILHTLCREKNCVIHAFWLSDAAMSGARMARKRHLPFFVTLMGQDVKAGNNYIRFMPAATQYIALSDHQRDVFESNYNAKVSDVIPFPLPEIKPAIGMHRSIDLLFVGSYIAVKQPMQFIEIVDEVRRQHPGIRAVMSGGGPLKPELEKMVAEKGLHNNIIIQDLLPREHVFETMQRARILVHTSAFEGQCLVYGEALLSGMHVLSYPVGRIVPTPKHVICHHTSEFVLNIMQLLSHPVNFTPLQTVHAQESIASHLWLYGMQKNT